MSVPTPVLSWSLHLRCLLVCFGQVWHQGFLRCAVWLSPQGAFPLCGGGMWSPLQHPGWSHQARQVSRGQEAWGVWESSAVHTAVQHHPRFLSKGMEYPSKEWVRPSVATQGPEPEGVIGKEMLQILRQICYHSWSLLLDGSLWLTAGSDWLLLTALGSCPTADLSDCSDSGVSLILTWFGTYLHPS